MIVLPPVPKMYIGYQRFSLKGIEEDIRITFMVGTCIKSNTIYYQVHSLNMELHINNIYKKEGNIVLNELLTTSVTAREITIKSFFLCIVVSIILGILGAVIYKNNYSKHFVLIF